MVKNLKTVSLTIDRKTINVPVGVTVFQACQLQGVEIPHFCYHQRLSIAGNCRMCLVEMKGSPKPVASCAMQAAQGMEIATQSAMAVEARQGVMEFLLINHPLDCPICDQGGECDLQDLAMAYGRGQSRFLENKRSVREKEFGPLIKTEMTRCIHCTRCIRFATEIAGVEDLGATGRGENMEVGTYIEKALTSELSGNMIDLCPVGALTSKPYAFRARSWELEKTPSIDVMDAVGSHIRVDSFNHQVQRILPRVNDDINEEWISDKTRFSCDGLPLQRLDRPWIRRRGRLVETSWGHALSKVAAALTKAAPDKAAVIAGDMCCVESMKALLDLYRHLSIPHIDCRQDGAGLDSRYLASYTFNTTIAGIEDADACLIFGAQPRLEAPLINARLRKRALMGDFRAGFIGPQADLNWPLDWLGNDTAIFADIVAGKHPFARVLRRAKRPMIIIGMAVLKDTDAPQILRHAHQLCQNANIVKDNWNGFNVLHNAAARVGGLDLGFVPGPKGMSSAAIVTAANKGRLNFLWLLGADELALMPSEKTVVVYQGHHGDAGAAAADIILPGAAYTEKSATYVNTEGRVQRTSMALAPPGQAREDWSIIHGVASAIGWGLDYGDVKGLRNAIRKDFPHLSVHRPLTPRPWPSSLGADGPIKSRQLSFSGYDFYLNDPISRSSPTMATCSANSDASGASDIKKAS